MKMKLTVTSENPLRFREVNPMGEEPEIRYFNKHWDVWQEAESKLRTFRLKSRVEEIEGLARKLFNKQFPDWALHDGITDNILKVVKAALSSQRLDGKKVFVAVPVSERLPTDGKKHTFHLKYPLGTVDEGETNFTDSYAIRPEHIKYIKRYFDYWLEEQNAFSEEDMIGFVRYWEKGDWTKDYKYPDKPTMQDVLKKYLTPTYTLNEVYEIDESKLVEV